MNTVIRVYVLIYGKAFFDARTRTDTTARDTYAKTAKNPCFAMFYCSLPYKHGRLFTYKGLTQTFVCTDLFEHDNKITIATPMSQYELLGIH